jgi:hypothetical protein
MSGSLWQTGVGYERQPVALERAVDLGEFDPGAEVATPVRAVATCISMATATASMPTTCETADTNAGPMNDFPRAHAAPSM